MKKARTIELTFGAAVIAPTLFAQPQFKGMGLSVLGPNGKPDTFVNALADDGSSFGRVGWGPSCWSLQSGQSLLLSLNAGGWGQVTACSENGKLLFGTSWDGVSPKSPDLPVCWISREAPPISIAGFPQGWTCYNVACNADGTVVAGQMQNLATFKLGLFIWRAGVRKNQGWEIITEFPAPAADVGLTDLNDAGDRGVGTGYSGSFFGALWEKKNGLSYVFDLPGGLDRCGFSSCDATGGVAFGYAMPGQNNMARWTLGSGLVPLGTLKPDHIGSGSGTSAVDASGWVAVGVSDLSGNILNNTAIIWNPINGMRAVKDVLVEDYGLDEVKPWHLHRTDVISPNGRNIAGRGLNPQGVQESWWAEVVPFCYADCDRSSTPKGGPPTLDIDDFICYMTHFALDDLYANCNNDADLDIDDFICFQTAWACGC